MCMGVCFSLCVCLHHLHVWCPWKPEEGIWIPWNWMSHYVGARSETQVLWKSNQCSSLLSYFPSLPKGKSFFLSDKKGGKEVT